MAVYKMSAKVTHLLYIIIKICKRPVVYQYIGLCLFNFFEVWYLLLKIINVLINIKIKIINVKLNTK
jgi:hypothetical protein